MPLLLLRLLLLLVDLVGNTLCLLYAQVPKLRISNQSNSMIDVSNPAW